MPCVDGLNGRLVFGGKFSEVHHLRAVDEFPPVEVLPVVGGEVGKHGMVFLYIGAGGVRRSHLKPAGVPEDRHVGVAHVVAVAHFPCGGDEHLAASAEHVEGFSVDGVSITVSEDLTTRIGEETKRAWTREIGTYVSRQVPEDCFVLKGGKIVYSDGTLWQSAFTVYFDFFDIPATTSAGMSVSIGKDSMEVGKEEGNAILRMRKASSDDTIYDLTGKKVSGALRRGMYIRGGKVIIIR